MKKYVLFSSLFASSMVVLFATFVTSLQGQTVGYLYPAGGKIGTTFEMVVAGAGITQGEKVFVTGGGVDVKIFSRPMFGNFEHNSPYGGKCVRVWNAIFEEESKLLPLRNDPEKLEEARRVLRLNRHNLTQAIPVRLNDIPTPDDEEAFESTVYWHKLRNPTIRDLQLIYYEYDGSTIEFYKKRHSSFGSVLMVEVTIAPDAKPGLRELYVAMPNGSLSRGIKFWVSDVNEVTEIEPNEGTIWWRWQDRFKEYVELPVQQIPVVFNGQIKPGDVDRFYFEGKKGQHCVIDVQSRSTAPYIANAVPGWFAAVATLFGPDGKQVQYTEAWRFDQNPMMTVVLPQDGKYMLEILDSIYRGRNDFVYRMSVGTFPCVTSQFPLGGRVNENTTIQLVGENLPTNSVSPDFKGDVFYEEVREITSLAGKQLIRPIQYVVETLPIYLDLSRSVAAGGYKADATPKTAQPAPAPAPVVKAPVPAPAPAPAKPVPAPAPVVKAPVPAPVKPAPAPAPVAKAPVPAPAPAPAKPAPAPVVKVAIAQNAPVKVKPSIPKISFPVVVYGRIETCNAVNSYQFDGKKGQKVALDVMAQSLGSALDAVVELLDPSGKTIASNDDRAGCDGPNIGEEVCHSDPNVICELPADGVYTARVFGVSRRGGPEYYYRLRISGPQPNFDVCMIPSRITIRGKNANFKVKVFRWEGFDGEITLRCNGAYAETKFSRKGIIKPTENEVNFSIVLPEKQTEDAFELDMVAEATVNGKKLTRKILPVDDWEQAFIYHHLVPHAKLIAIQK